MRPTSARVRFLHGIEATTSKLATTACVLWRKVKLKIPDTYHVEIKCKVGSSVLGDYIDILTNSSVESERFFNGYTLYFTGMKTRATSKTDWISIYLLSTSHKRRILATEFQNLVLDKFTSKRPKRVQYFGGLQADDLQPYSKIFGQ